MHALSSLLSILSARQILVLGLTSPVAKNQAEDRSHDDDLYVWRTGDGRQLGGPLRVQPKLMAAGDPVPALKTTTSKATSGSNTSLCERKPNVIPKWKFAFCSLPKVASWDFTNIFNTVNHVEKTKGSVWDHFHQSSPEGLGFPRSDVTRENGWQFAFFTRDPLTRYLSAWGSKCVVSEFGWVEANGSKCGGDVIWDPSPLEVLRTAFEKRVWQDVSKGLTQNAHWEPQTVGLAKCGSEFSVDLAEFVGDLSADSVTEQVKSMFAVVGARGAAIESLIEEYFPPVEPAGHQSATHELYESFYKNETVKKAVVHLYEQDYEALHLAYP